MVQLYLNAVKLNGLAMRCTAGNVRYIGHTHTHARIYVVQFLKLFMK